MAGKQQPEGSRAESERFEFPITTAVAGALAVGVLGAFTGCNTDALGAVLWGTPMWRFTLIGVVNGVAVGLLLARPRLGRDPSGRSARVASARRALGYGLAWLSSALWAFVGAYLVVVARLPEPPKPTVVHAAFPLNRPDHETRLVIAPNHSGEASVYLTFPSDGNAGKSLILPARRRIYVLWSVTPNGDGRTGPRKWCRAIGNGDPVYEGGNVFIGQVETRRGQAYDVRVRLRSASTSLRTEKPTLTIEGADEYRPDGYLDVFLCFAGILALVVAVPCLCAAIVRWRQIDRCIT